jgi:hypothetical protein
MLYKLWRPELLQLEETAAADATEAGERMRTWLHMVRAPVCNHRPNTREPTFRACGPTFLACGPTFLAWQPTFLAWKPTFLT